MLIKDVAIYTDFKLDESYTPTKISVRVGTNFNDLQEIEVYMIYILFFALLLISLWFMHAYYFNIDI